MSTIVTMPKLGLTMKSGKVSKWFKEQGAQVAKGEDLLEVETDKITNKVEAPESGVLYRILVPAKKEAAVGADLAVIAAPGEAPDVPDVAGAAPAEQTSGGKAPVAAAAPVASRAEISASPAARRLAREYSLDLSLVKGGGPDGRITEKDVREFHEALGKIKITPLAAVLAAQAGLDIRTLKGSGEGGKITREDVNRALHPEAVRPEAVVEDAADLSAGGVIPISGMRLAIAENMSMSLRNTAQLTLVTEVDVTQSLAFLAEVRAARKKDPAFRISLNDVLILVVSRALQKFPRMNSTREGEAIIVHAAANVGIAVALPEGLIVPVLRDAHRKGLEQIAKESRALAEKARTGTLDPDEVTGGTFTVTNMGRTVVDLFTPILKPCETGILGVGRVTEKAVVVKGAIEIRSMMGLSLTFDHRVLDGTPAAEFLGVVCDFLQHPAVMLF